MAPTPSSDAPPFDDPMRWFDTWLGQARQADMPEHDACCLATVSASGQPSARVVLLKEWGEEGFVIYTNLESRKGREALSQGKGALTFYWRELARQIRIEGALERVSDARADAYFATRQRGSQIGAWASHQSRPLESRAALAERVAALEAKYAGRPVPRPPHWSGLLLAPALIEFWSARQDRLHDRVVFTRPDQGAPWSLGRLNP